MDKALIIAHRGAHQTAPENTIASFEAAIACQADMIELDIRKSADGFFLVFHDESIQNKPISLTPYQTIRNLGLRQGIEIPLFEEVLKLTRNRIKLDIEIKEIGDELEIVEMVLKYFKREDFIITSFQKASLTLIKKIDPRIRVGLIIGEEGFRNLLKSRMFDLFPFNRCRKSGIDIIVAHWKILRFGFLKRAWRLNIPVFVWTVNASKKMHRFLNDRRVCGIITDKPELAKLPDQMPGVRMKNILII